MEAPCLKVPTSSNHRLRYDTLLLNYIQTTLRKPNATNSCRSNSVVVSNFTNPPTSLLLLLLPSLHIYLQNNPQSHSSMAKPKQQQEAYLNQPYYGPSVLPTGAESSSSPRLKLDGYSLLCLFLKVFTTILIIVGIVVLALWLVYQPQSVKVYADTAVLSVFNLSNSGNHSSLNYNLTLTLSFRNPNRKYDTNYELLNADAWYSNNLHLGSVALPRFRQNRKSMTLVSTRFEGRTEVPPGDRWVEESFGRERDEGFFRIRIRMYATLRLKMVAVESVKFKPDVDCYLTIPSPTNATSLAAGFSSVECDVYNFS